MQCDEARELLVDYVYGDLIADERREIEMHLQSCEMCSAELGHLRKTRDALALLGSQAPPLREAKAQSRRKPNIGRIFAYIVAGAVAAMMLIVLWPEPTAVGPEVRKGTLIPEAFAAPEVKRKHVALTVYNGGFGVVRDGRIVTNLPEGECELRFKDVAALIEPHTVKLRSLTKPHGVTVLEQDFLCDLVGVQRMLEKQVGQRVKFLLRDGTMAEGVLASAGDPADSGVHKRVPSPGRENWVGRVNRDNPWRKDLDYVVRGDRGEMRTIPMEQIRHIGFEGELAAGFVTRPTLRWRLGVAKDAGGNHDLELTYLTQGVNWRSDYDLVLGSDVTELLCWLTLDNNCGTRFEDAKLKLVAGDVHRAPEQRQPVPAPGAAQEGKDPNAVQVTEKEFFEYHMYEVTQPVTVANGETKQIKMFERGIKDLKKEYKATASAYQRMDAADMRRPSVVILVFKNSRENGLGLPLPAGRVRLFVPVEGENLFAQFSQLDHTPKDEDVKLVFGETQSIVWRVAGGEVKRTGRSERGNQHIVIRNLGDRDAVLHFKTLLYGDWKITESSHQYEKEDTRGTTFHLNIKAGEELKLEYSWESER